MFAKGGSKFRWLSRYYFFNQKFDKNVDYYQLLEINRHANEKQIKEAFYKLAKRYHPDSHKGFEEQFKKVNEAYQILSDPTTKREYDQARIPKFFGEKIKRDFRGGRGSQKQETQYQQQDYQQRSQWPGAGSGPYSGGPFWQQQQQYQQQYEQQQYNYQGYNQYNEHHSEFTAQDMKLFRRYMMRVMFRTFMVGFFFTLIFSMARTRQLQDPRFAQQNQPYRGPYPNPSPNRNPYQDDPWSSVQQNLQQQPRRGF